MIKKLVDKQFLIHKELKITKIKIAIQTIRKKDKEEKEEKILRKKLIKSHQMILSFQIYHLNKPNCTKIKTFKL
jgi:hypothetical protein